MDEIKDSFNMEDHVNKNLTMEYVSQFNWTDYLILMIIICIPLPISIYYGFFEKGKISIMEYMLGKRKMKILPVAFSLAASFTSSLTIIGIPTEVYMNGSLIWLTIPATILACILAYFFFIPIFYELNIISAYHYIELRFNTRLKSLISILFCITNIAMLPVFIYAPALIFSEVINIKIPIIATGLIFACILYSTSGFRPLAWIGFLHTIFVLIIIFSIVTIGTVYSGGISHVFKTVFDDGKINIFKMDPNPFQRNTFWTILFGTFFTWTCGLISSQTSLQRLMSLKSLKEAKIAIVIFLLIISLMITILIYGGYVLYSSFYGCDPIEQMIISRPDQIFPYFVITKLGHIPTISGMFMAALFCATISSYSNVLNSISYTIYEDFLRPKHKSETTGQYMMIWIMSIIATYSYLQIVLMDINIISMIFSILNLTAISISLVFIMGMMIPFANTIGVVTGIIINFIFLLWISIGSITSKFDYYTMSVYEKPSSTCTGFEDNYYYNLTQTYTLEKDSILTLYKLSNSLYFPVGLFIGLITGIIVSCLTRSRNLHSIDPLLISPPIRGFLRKNIKNSNEMAEADIMMTNYASRNSAEVI